MRTQTHAITALLLSVTVLVAVAAFEDEEYYNLNSSPVRASKTAVSPEPAKHGGKPFFHHHAAAVTTIANLLISTTSAPNTRSNPTDTTTKAKTIALENHPLLRAIHYTVCYGLSQPKPAARSSNNEDNTVIINDGQKDLLFRVVQSAATAPALSSLIPNALTDKIKTATKFFYDISPLHPWLGLMIPKLRNSTNNVEVEAVFEDVKARLYRNVFRTATSVLFSSGSDETGTFDNVDKLCAKLTEAEQEAMDFRRIAIFKRGLDDTGRHDPDEVSDGEDDDNDGPTWF